MADDNRIIPFRGKIPSTTAAGAPTLETIDRHELMLEELRAELRGELFGLNRVVDQQIRVIQVHHTALIDLTAALHTLQQRTVRGRIRRLLVWLEDRRLRVRAVAIALGLADPFDVAPYGDVEQAMAERERLAREGTPP